MTKATRKDKAWTEIANDGETVTSVMGVSGEESGTFPGEGLLVREVLWDGDHPISIAMSWLPGVVLGDLRPMKDTENEEAKS